MALFSIMLWRTSLRDVAGSNLPPRAPDRFFMLTFFVLVVFLERHFMRQMVVAPWLCALVFMIVSPSSNDMDNREQALRSEVRLRTERYLYNRIPATPKESSAWVGRLLSCYWTPFFEPLILRNTMLPIQEQLEASAPPGWSLTLESFSLGDTAPVLTDWQVFNNVKTGEVDMMTASVDFNSTSFRTELSGTGPFVGKFFATLQGISLRGSMVFTPVNDARILLFSFTERPDINVKLAVRGPVIGTQSIPQFAFLRSAIIGAIETDFVEPNRGMIPLDYEVIPGRPLASEIVVRVIKVYGLSKVDNAPSLRSVLASHAEEDTEDGISIVLDSSPRTNWGSKVSGAVQSAIERATPMVHAVKVNLSIPDMKLSRETGVHAVSKTRGDADIGETVMLQLNAPKGVVFLHVADESGRVQGTARLHAAHLPDGATAFWGASRMPRAIAARWTPDRKPWRTALPLAGSDHAGIVIEVSMTPWQYSLDVSTTAAAKFRTGLRSTVAVQVLEGRNLVSKDLGGQSDPYVLLSYNQRAGSTRCIYETLDPVYNEVLLFQENRSILSRRLKLEVFDRDQLTKDDSCGFATINLDLVAEGQVLDQWVQLRGESRGEVHLRLFVLSGSSDDKEVMQTASDAFEADPPRYSTDIVKVTVVRTQNVTSRDGKPLNVMVQCAGVKQSTGRTPYDADTKAYDWNEALSFRCKASELIRFTLKSGSGKEMVHQGNELGRASLVPTVVHTDLARLRAQARDGADSQSNSKQSRSAPVSISRLLYGDLGRDQHSAQRHQAPGNVAVAASKKPPLQSTTVVEQWLPLSGGGLPSNARLLVRVQGVLGVEASLPPFSSRNGIEGPESTHDIVSQSHDDDDARFDASQIVVWLRKKSKALAAALLD